MELDTLIDRCRRGDELAWEALVRRYQARVYAIACHYLGKTEEARDAAQEVFIRVYGRLEICTTAETFTPWLVQIARNLCIDRVRRRKARPQWVGKPIEEMRHLAASGSDPAEEWERTSRRDLVHRALERMGELGREMILLREIQDLSIEQIASILRLPKGTVKSRSSRARLDLAREVVALQREAEEPRGEVRQ